jgi:hypothetical protein
MLLNSLEIVPMLDLIFSKSKWIWPKYWKNKCQTALSLCPNQKIVPAFARKQWVKKEKLVLSGIKLELYYCPDIIATLVVTCGRAVEFQRAMVSFVPSLNSHCLYCPLHLS